jgi:hypothetical protein
VDLGNTPVLPSLLDDDEKRRRDILHQLMTDVMEALCRAERLRAYDLILCSKKDKEDTST